MRGLEACSKGVPQSFRRRPRNPYKICLLALTPLNPPLGTIPFGGILSLIQFIRPLV